MFDLGLPTRNNKKYVMTLIDGQFCLRLGAAHRPKPRFGRHF